MIRHMQIQNVGRILQTTTTKKTCESCFALLPSSEVLPVFNKPRPLGLVACKKKKRPKKKHWHSGVMKDAGSIEMLSKFSLVNQFRAQRPSHRDERTARRIQATSRARSTAATSVSIHRLACLCLSLSLSSMLSRAFSPCLCLPCQWSTVEPGVLCVCCLPCSRRLPLPLPLALASRLRSWRACRVAESRHGSHGACREHPRAAEIHCSIFPSYFFLSLLFSLFIVPPPPPPFHFPQLHRPPLL